MGLVSSFKLAVALLIVTVLDFLFSLLNLFSELPEFCCDLHQLFVVILTLQMHVTLKGMKCESKRKIFFEEFPYVPPYRMLHPKSA